MKTIYVEVEENDNCEYIPMLAYEVREEPVSITRVRLFEPDHPQGVYQITGWSSDGDGRPCPALLGTFLYQTQDRLLSTLSMGETGE